MQSINTSPLAARAVRKGGYGFHYFPDEQHYRIADLERWLPELQALGAAWLTLRASAERAVPEAFINALVQAGIEPIIHIPHSGVEPFDLEDLASLAAAYRNWGVNYVVLYDQPNQREQWPAGTFDQLHLIERFLTCWLPAVKVLRACGLAAVFPPLRQGGTFWDLSFLRTSIETLTAWGETELMHDMILGAYAFAGPHPADWGRGGQTAWPAAQPYCTPPGSEDQLGFRAFEWYAEVTAECLGQPLPTLVLAGGARFGELDTKTGQPLDIAWHTTCNANIAHAMTNRHLPDYLLNMNFWLLAAEGQPAAAAAWFPAGSQPLPVCQQLSTPVASAALASNANKPGAAKRLPHYVLLPTLEHGPSEWHWRAAGGFVRDQHAACGYSAEDAAAALQVTVVGSEQEISRQVETGLRGIGCKVRRVAGADFGQLTANLAANAIPVPATA
ncbi:MAG: hypothetical protein DWI62_00260 [Chloroflexi bacterium]|nr:MAG: hypothetical protein DWI62_00260 [Chloroflexota bacterium]